LDPSGWFTPQGLDLDWGDPSSFGATAWNKFKPKVSTANLGQFLAEMRDVPRMLKKTAKDFKDIYMSWKPAGQQSNWIDHAGTWLNYQFGWKPFVSDILSFFRFAERFEKRYQHIRRNNGKWRRVGGTVHSDISEVVHKDDQDLTIWPALPSNYFKYLNGPFGSSFVQSTFTDEVWFRGAMRFYIPFLPEGPVNKALIAPFMLGLVPSPALVWELIPWSWLIDWVANVGDVMSNISDIALNGVAAKYAYVMRRRTQEILARSCGFLRDETICVDRVARFVSKQRLPASPFGFSLQVDDFTAWHLSILSALGLSRLR
jgi:hypothetical protein